MVPLGDYRRIWASSAAKGAGEANELLEQKNEKKGKKQTCKYFTVRKILRKKFQERVGLISYRG